MVYLTRVKGSSFYLNPMMIELIESTPDTVITLVSGKKYVVQESTNDVVSRMTEYYKKIGIAGVIAAQVGDDHLE